MALLVLTSVDRIKDLKLESVKQGRKAFVNADQLQLLDGLHAHIERGGTTLGFIQLLKKQGYQLTHDSTVNSPVSYSENLNHSEPTISLNPTALVNVIETVVKRIVPQSTRRLTYLEELESAYQNGWLLSTSEVSDLLGQCLKYQTAITSNIKPTSKQICIKKIDQS
jgi:hypothetical protein